MVKTRNARGPVPSIRNSSEVTEPEVKIKRKCGRPRNPIPRHRRVSHINAEQRRRSKIQIGLQTLKGMVPKDMPTGRDSKADVLTKAVEHTKYLKALHKTMTEQVEDLKEQQRQLNLDIERYQENLPEGKLFDEKPRTAEQRFADIVEERTNENYKYYIFSYIMKPLHQNFEQMVDCRTLDSFHDSTCAWANAFLSQKGLRPVITEALRTLSTQTSFIDKPHQMAEEALQRSRQKTKAIPATITSADPCASSTQSRHQSSSHKHHHTASRKQKARSGKQVKKSGSSTSCSSSRSLSSSDPVSSALPLPGLFQPASTEPASHHYHHQHHQQQSPDLNMLFGSSLSPPPAAAVKTESLPSCSLPLSAASHLVSHVDSSSAILPKTEAEIWASYVPSTDLASHEVDSPLSIDSAIELSPPRSSYDSSVFGDLTGCDSSLDQCYDQEAVTAAAANYPISSNENFLQHGHPATMSAHGGQSILGDLENFDICDFVGSFRDPLHPGSVSDCFDPQFLDMDMPSMLSDASLDLMDGGGSQSLLDLFGNIHQDDGCNNDPRLMSL